MIGDYCKCKLFCCEDISLIENYDKAINDINNTYYCHHRLETHYSNGLRRVNEPDLTAKELKNKNLYYNRPANELIFLTNSKHSKLHFKTRFEHFNELSCKEKFHEIMKSEEYRNKLSESHKGKKRSKESKLKQSETCKGKKLSDETKQKMSKTQKGLKWFTNGIIVVHTSNCPEGFRHGRLPQKETQKEKVSKANTGKHWYNNGNVQTLAFTAPDGFIPGQLKGRVISPEKRINYSYCNKDKHWYNNGVVNKLDYDCPKGFLPGKLKCLSSTRKKMSESAKGKHWYNNGIISVHVKECPEGFIPGRLPLKRK